MFICQIGIAEFKRFLHVPASLVVAVFVQVDFFFSMRGMWHVTRIYPRTIYTLCHGNMDSFS